MQRMWRQMFAAVAGVLVVAGLAAAQSPNPIPQQLPLSPARVQYVPVQAPQFAAPLAPTIAPAAGSVFVKGSGGCNSCGNTTAKSSSCSYGNTCNNGCGSVKSTCGFMFGSCKSFFNPCGPLPSNGCGDGKGNGNGKHGSKCGTLPLGKPYAYGYNGCVYDTYLNH